MYFVVLYISISPTGGKVETKSKLVRQLGDTVDLTAFDYQSGRQIMTQGQSCSMQQNLVFQRPSPSTSLKRCNSDSLTAIGNSSGAATASSASSMTIKQPYEFRLLMILIIYLNAFTGKILSFYLDFALFSFYLFDIR